MRSIPPREWPQPVIIPKPGDCFRVEGRNVFMTVDTVERQEGDGWLVRTFQGVRWLLSASDPPNDQIPFTAIEVPVTPQRQTARPRPTPSRAKSALKHLIAAIVARLGAGTVGRYVYGQIVDQVMARTQRVRHGGVDLIFATPNALNAYRATTFSAKEPETLEWIDAIPEGSVVWDIGANVGLYTCYAAKARGCRVFAFEPSVFNVECLARNVYLNGLTELVTIVPLAVSEDTTVSTLNMTTTDWGGALSTFGHQFGHDGAPLATVFAFRTVGLSLVGARDALGIPQPDYLKLDVDGIEHLILRGGGAVLQAARGLLVEINDQFTAQAVEAQRHLRDAGFTLRAKKHADCFDADPTDARYTFNQIWAR